MPVYKSLGKNTKSDEKKDENKKKEDEENARKRREEMDAEIQKKVIVLKFRTLFLFHTSVPNQFLLPKFTASDKAGHRSKTDGDHRGSSSIVPTMTF